MMRKRTHVVVVVMVPASSLDIVDAGLVSCPGYVLEGSSCEPLKMALGRNDESRLNL